MRKIEDGNQQHFSSSQTARIAGSCTDRGRRRMRENGQVIIAVEPNEAAGQMKLQAVKTSDGKNWWAVFTSFDEELKGGKSVMSTFMTDIGKVLETALSEEEISGVIINPWNRTLMLDKTLIRIVLGDVTQ